MDDRGLLRRHGLDRKTGGLPFGIAILQPAYDVAARPQHCDGFEREDAIGATAIGHDLPASGELGQPAVKLTERNVERARKMAAHKLVLGAHVENGYKSRLET
jgi:hypothetical protein